MIINSNKLDITDNVLYCEECGKTSEQVNLWWSDGRNDDGLGYSELHVHCASCDNELTKKSAFGEINSIEDALSTFNHGTSIER